MCGRFSQSMTREDYLILLASESERDSPYDPEPIRKFEVAACIKALLLLRSWHKERPKGLSKSIRGSP